MENALSILLPTYNDVCYELVAALCRQASTIEGLRYEVLVADDGSTEEAAKETNRSINALAHAQYIEREVNSGRAAIRNFLAQEAQYDRLLFIDSDMTLIREDFLRTYLLQTDDAVVYGGYTVSDGGQDMSHNLRYRYEKQAEAAHTAECRNLAPYRDFHTSNFLVNRNIFLNHPLDERFKHYGYEDVLWGKQLKAQGIAIRHIDNPMGFHTFEDNAHFVSKTEEALHTLHLFRRELKDYSPLLDLAERLTQLHLAPVVRLFHRLFGALERHLLCSRHPSTTILSIYKLGELLRLMKEEQRTEH